ncbi:MULTISPECIES: NUDIX hydrolase [Rhodococcus]|jgi:ADP-ribose pyrophosphatase YjhB (NUDIX family)|uniref:NUDIX domain-containing protein n=1 Tax=Rhodococcus oxybenzonivorans TaxID=1990687 RepID=A0AAE5A407_9NOCA|nr:MULTISPECIES: NUDIX domain-containing protein [Rhodococcus]MDV7244112.1 NUDIX domain-containing protein [Rhodococcus oxybenzonivorans]MDV7263107.1 NUDIX domain-containing protein [Rhodococcus oxybenzonivorans]MDV7274646.1 NUDIX domain-containing protein [Rhodococcus oxybenzonivorans]MDV7335959.1 NUDIX domain-containing protein [Rhodococcus oxybenzonivorans]MDV7345596.1 NUDIX domain-containing protein [Rhodococcus oxybenzonivorans]
MPHSNTRHEVLTAVFQVRHFADRICTGHAGDARHATGAGELAVLLWQRALDPQAGAWSLPGGLLGEDEDLTTSARRQLAEKVDVREVSHLEQLSVFSDPHRVPGPRTIASTFLGLVPLPADPTLPPDTAWHPVSELPEMAFDHGTVVQHARTRLAAKLSYTNIAFGLAPGEFSMSTLREIYCAALGYQVDATNLQRVLGRRGVLKPTGNTAPSGRTGGRPAALYRFTDSTLRVTDEFAALRPPA